MGTGQSRDLERRGGAGTMSPERAMSPGSDAESLTTTNAVPHYSGSVVVPQEREAPGDEESVKKKSLRARGEGKARREMVATMFMWGFGGDQVLLAGTFNGWKKPLPLSRTAQNMHSIMLDLPPGRYQYKFIVDGEWRFSPDQPTIADAEGRISNIIEVVMHEPSVDKKAETSPRESYSQDVPTIPPVRQPSTAPAAVRKKEGAPHVLPPHLYHILLNTDTQEEREAPADVLPIPQTVTLNHLYRSYVEEQKGKHRVKELAGVMVAGMTERYESKFVTTLLYMPEQ